MSRQRGLSRVAHEIYDIIRSENNHRMLCQVDDFRSNMNIQLPYIPSLTKAQDGSVIKALARCPFSESEHLICQHEILVRPASVDYYLKSH